MGARGEKTIPNLQGIGRNQTLQFPPRLDDYIRAENPVRFLDAFMDQLDLQSMGFSRVEADVEGRPAYPPGELLKLYLYGYLNRVCSSRCLERESQRNVEVMWLLKCLTPEHKTIADFRKEHPKALQKVFREFIDRISSSDIAITLKRYPCTGKAIILVLCFKHEL